MEYKKIIALKNGEACFLRNGMERDGQAVLENFNLTHAQTDYLLSYPDEAGNDATQKSQYLKEKATSEHEVEIIAIVNNVIAGTAGVEAVGSPYKVRHRAELGISVDKAYWKLGIGRALLNACIECAKKAGYIQLELSVVSDNRRAISMYEKAGFVEYGRNPKGFKSRIAGFQEIVHMRLEL